VIDDRAVVERSVFVGLSGRRERRSEYAAGDRARFFSGVPEYRAAATAAVGRDLFKKTSGFRVSAEYVRVGSRKAGSSDPLSPYGVLQSKACRASHRREPLRAMAHVTG